MPRAVNPQVKEQNTDQAAPNGNGNGHANGHGRLPPVPPAAAPFAPPVCQELESRYQRQKRRYFPSARPTPEEQAAQEAAAARREQAALHKTRHWREARGQMVTFEMEATAAGDLIALLEDVALHADNYQRLRAACTHAEALRDQYDDQANWHAEDREVTESILPHYLRRRRGPERDS